MIGPCKSCPNCPIVQQGDANFPCNFCDQVFCQNVDRKNHIRYGHEDARYGSYKKSLITIFGYKMKKIHQKRGCLIRTQGEYFASGITMKV